MSGNTGYGHNGNMTRMVAEKKDDNDDSDGEIEREIKEYSYGQHSESGGKGSLYETLFFSETYRYPSVENPLLCRISSHEECCRKGSPGV